MRCHLGRANLYAALWLVSVRQVAHAAGGIREGFFGAHFGRAPVTTHRDSSTQVVDIPFQTQDPEENGRQPYMINCSIGNPPQSVTLVLRTEYGDTDLEENIIWQGPISHYQPSASTTYRGNILSAGWNTSNGGTVSEGTTGYNVTYASDDFVIAGITLNDMPFISESNKSSPGAVHPGYALFYRLGLGLPQSEAAIWSDDSGTGTPYPTFLQRILSKGLILSTTYSIWRDGGTSLSGHLLLGGLNTKRYQGALTNLQTSTTTSTNVLEIGYLTQLTVKVSSVSITTIVGTISTITNVSMPATIDSLALIQYPGTVLPASAVAAIYSAMGASLDPANSIPIVPCSYLTNTSTLNLDLVSDTGPNFFWPIPFSDIIVHNGSFPYFSTGPYAAACKINIGVIPDGQDFAALSPQMMRTLYTVYDLSNNVISVATTNFNATEDDLVAIPTGGVAAIPSTMLGSVTTQPTSLATAATSGSPKSGATVDDRPGLALPLGIGVGLGVPVLLMCTGLLYALYNKKRKRSAKASSIDVDDMSSPGELAADRMMRSHAADEQHREGRMQEHMELYGDNYMRGELSGDGQITHYELGTNGPLTELADSGK